MMEPKKIITYKPGPQWPRPLPERSEGIHPIPTKYFIRRVNCDSNIGGDTCDLCRYFDSNLDGE